MERRTSISAREIAAAMLLGIGTYLEYSADADPATRKYAPACGLLSGLGGLLLPLLAGERMGRGGSRPGLRLIFQIGALVTALFYAWVQRRTQKRR